MNQKIKFGIVGLGHIGNRHANCIIENPKSVLCAVCDIVEKKTWEQNSNVMFFNSFDSLLQQDLDVINICAPNYLHASMAISALNSGKHVIIEKPMALSTEDAKKIIKQSVVNNKLVFGVMQNRFSPTVIWLKKIINQGLLGKINFVLVNCFWNRNSDYYLKSDWHGSKLKDGGPLFTQFSHFIDIINWIFGDFSNIKAQFRSFNPRDYVEFEDSGIVQFNLEDAVTSKNSIFATLTYSTSVWNKNFESSITIIGENGTLKIGGQYMDKVTYCDIKEYTLPDLNTSVKCNDYGDYKGSASNHDQMLDAAINMIVKNSDDTSCVSLQDGVNVVNIIERIYSLRN